MTHAFPIAARAAFVAALLALAACDSPEERVQKHFDRGMQFAEAEDVDRALIELRNALKLDPNHVASRFEIAKLFEARGEFQAAAGNYRAAADFDPAHLDARIALAQLLSMGGALDEALEGAEQAVALGPQNPDALSTEAAIRFRLEETEAALALAEKALAIDPAALGANVVLITHQARNGDSAGALARLDARLAEAPRDRTLLLLKAQILVEANDQPALGAHLAQLVELFPEEVVFRRQLAAWHLAQGDSAAAESEMRAIAAASPGDVQAALDVARFLAAAKGAEAARAELSALVDAAPTTEARLTYAVALAEIEATMGERAQAKARLEPLVKDSGAEANPARLLLARLHLADGDDASAATILDSALQVDPRDGEARALRSSLLIDADRPDEAVAEIRVALEGDPENERFLMIAARAQERAGNPDAAGEHLAAAMRASNHAPMVAGAYARFLVGRDQVDAAETVLAEAARRHPQDAATLAALGDIRIRRQDWAGVEAAAVALAALENGGPAAARLRAAALSGQNRLAESARLLEGLALGEDGSAAALPGLISTYLRLGDVDRARRTLDDRLAADPKDLVALLLRAELHFFEGQRPEAEERLRAAVAANSENPVAHLALHRFALATGDAALADAALEDGLASTPASAAAPLRFARAARFEMAGDFDAAISEYEALYEGDPDSAVVANNLASLIAETRGEDPVSVERAARIAQRLRSSEEPHFQDTWGWIQFLQGRHEEALRALRPAAEALPQNPLVRYHVGRVYAATGASAEARTHLEAALAIDPSFSKADSARATLAALSSGDDG